VRATSVLAPLACSLICCGAVGVAPAAAFKTPKVRHLFVILLENQGYGATFGTPTADPYLAQTLPAEGALLENYYATGHESNDNYVSLVSGQPPNPENQSDCQSFNDFTGPGTRADGVEEGVGCVYPSNIANVGTQLSAHKLRWKAYMEDMGNIPSREAAACGHPAVNGIDHTQTAVAGDGYATRHDPFVYFRSIIDTPACSADVVPLTGFSNDLRKVSTTANLSYITPNLCNDGHDSPCADGSPGGLASADAWLQAWVPQILASPGYQKNGVLVITFDESSGPQSDSSVCCGEGPGPNTPLPGILGLGGGQVGAVVLSRWVRPGGTDVTPYNHYSLLASIEQIFGVGRLGYAATATPFGRDVFTNYRIR
jgi:hypothetical protein